MRLSLIFELLLIFLLLAFAASRVIDSKSLHNIHGRTAAHKPGKAVHKNRQDAANKYCSCSSKLCNCCREFHVPVLALQGPGCASLQYLKGDRLAISMSFGERVLTNTTISGKKPKPVCMPLPGGISKFCGRVYNIGRQGEDFNACLGLELRALEDVEASLRVSCFRFGPQGMKVEQSQPLPIVEEEVDEDDDEDDFELDDEYDDDDDNDIESVEYEGFSVFDDDFINGLFQFQTDNQKKQIKKRLSSTTKAPTKKITQKPYRSTPNNVKRQPAIKKHTTTRPSFSSVTNKVPLNIKRVTSTVVLTKPTVHLSRQPTKTVQKPKNPSVILSTTPYIKFGDKTAFEEILSIPHESITAKIAMLQHPVEGMEQVTTVEVQPVPDLTSIRNVTPAINPLSLTATNSPVPANTWFTSTIDIVTEETSVFTAQDIVVQNPTIPIMENILLDKTIVDKTENTEFTTASTGGETTLFTDKTDKYGDKSNVEPTENDESGLVTYGEEELLDKNNDINQTNADFKHEKNVKKGTNKPESEDILDEIVDGFVETISGDENDSADTNGVQKISTESDDDFNDYLGDDDDDDDDINGDNSKTKAPVSKMLKDRKQANRRKSKHVRLHNYT